MNSKIYQKKGNGLFLALVSFVLPGLGHLINGRFLKAVFFFFGTFVGYCFFVIPGLLMHLWCVIDSYHAKYVEIEQFSHN